MTSIGAAQMQSGSEVDLNIKQMDSLLQESTSQGCHFLVFPEECLTLQMPIEDKLQLSREGESLLKKVSKLAKVHQSTLIAGSIPLYADSNHYYSTCVMFNPLGELVARYEKIHLFDVMISDTVNFCESKRVKAGQTVVLADSDRGKLGFSICYDLRFPELYRQLLSKGAEILLAPSAFTPQTGVLHWHTLVKARAIENLCYVVAPNQNGLRDNGESTFGHSLIVDPWGVVLAEKAEGIGVIVAPIDLPALHERRRQFPVLKHRKL